MDAHADEDAAPAAQKFIFSKQDERRIRRRCIWAAFFFDAVAIALIIPLCVGGWVHNANQVGGTVNSEDIHLVTWSAVYRRTESQRQSTFVFTWFLSSCCFKEAYVDSSYALAGCVHRTPGSAFDLQSIIQDVEDRLGEQDNVEAGPITDPEGRFVGPSPAEFATADVVTSTRDALASYGIYLAINMGTWIFQIISKRHHYALNASHYRVMTTAQVLALFALLVASGITTAAAHKAKAALDEFDDVFPYHAVGSSFAALTWCAFVSHMLGCLAYVGAVLIWHRLQRPELYPPEPEDEIERARRAGARGEVAAYRLRRLDEPAVHREVDPNAAVDDELPPYSRVDPNEGRIVSQEGREPEIVEGPIELAHLRGIRNPPLQPVDEQGNTPAPAYELHQWPPNLRTLRRPET
ncbi:hypothetical protein CGCA056_v000951 [Colletotrichum aenigma]|uniref:uncharacterized protein n=1 Tax=Colletotrichum aenigma TaxID=1215731 RepID=UPI001872C34D|nr:uncharacterized protein CGCA056_v000951 [Colletotrichum aenigma]KAF5528097.1 hypothetical protein CGCA056_v000951 [Colletotrichum aenigma]